MSVSFNPQIISQPNISPKDQLIQIKNGSVSFLAAKISETAPSLISVLTNEIAGYAYEPNPKLTNWFYKLDAIAKLPAQIPPLPPHLIPFLHQKCPSLICNQTKPDGSSYTLAEKCTLTLIPKELGSVEELEKIVKTLPKRSQKTYHTHVSIHAIPIEARNIYPNVPFPETHWQLQTDTVFEESVNQTYEEQLLLLDTLSESTGVQWETPEFQGSIASLFLKAITTNKGSGEGNETSNTRLKEKMANGHLTISSDFSKPRVGIYVLVDSNSNSPHRGMGALLKISSQQNEQRAN